MNAEKNATCHLIYQSITSPTRYVYACLFILCGIFAAIGNTVALVILRQPHIQIKANRILVSLVVSDALVGYLLFPFVAYMMLTPSTFFSCNHRYTSGYLAYTLIGASIINVALVAYDRYILMTKLTSYNKYLSKTKINIFLFFTWFEPIVIATIEFFGEFTGSYLLHTVTRIAMGFNITTVMILLFVFYLLLVKSIKQKEKIMTCHRTKTNNRHVRLAKTVTLLLICYIACMFPSIVFLVITNIEDFPLPITQFFLFSLFTAGLNSCLNPIIYAARYPGFKKQLCFLVGWRQKVDGGRNKNRSITLSSTGVESFEID